MAIESSPKSQDEPKDLKEAQLRAYEASSERLLNAQIRSVVRFPEENDNPESLRAQRNGAAALVEVLGPADLFERMLITQIVAAHTMAMDCSYQAMNAQSFALREQMLKNATRLMTLGARQMEVLDKHRGKGQQKVTVEHVNVAAGGHAIVGNVETTAKSSRGKEQSNQAPLEIAHAPSVAFEMPEPAAAPVNHRKNRDDQNGA